MPSKNTSVISARVKDETAVKLGEIAENRGITIARLIDDMVAAYEEKEAAEKGVTPISCAVCEQSSEDFEENLRYKEVKFDRLLSAFERKKYPDLAIRQCVEQIISQLNEESEFNPRRSRNDDWC